MTYYRQCTLERNEFPAVVQQVSWIPEQFAIVGKYLELEGENGWRVMQVGTHRQSEDYIEDHERDWKGHRQRTDV